MVVGGGFAGFSLVKVLSTKLDSSRYNLILITAHPYFVHYIAGARLTVSDADNLEDLVFIPFDKIIAKGNGTHKVGTVTAIEKAGEGKGGYVVLEDGERVEYEALVLAPGTLWSGPLRLPTTDAAARDSLREWRRRYAEAKDIVLVGGGAVGIGTCMPR